MVTTTDVDEATQGVQVVIMVGGFPRKAGMERKDAMSSTILRKKLLLGVNCPGSDGL